MAPLQGTTLGEKHRYYNTLLKDKIAEGPVGLPKINYDDDDIDNMMRIDLASKERNVDFIMAVLKCDDMLYVSRAIKHSVWLVTEPEYAHIINPDYLHSDVFPEMMPKAITKLMLLIKRHLKDEKRVEAFFNYVDENNPNLAFKWLENCSFKFTEEIVARKANSISSSILKRLCKKSVKFLEVFVNNVDNGSIPFNSVMFLLKSHSEEFLDITESLPTWKHCKPSFDAKSTRMLLKKSFQRIVNNFYDYRSRIDIPIFVKYLKLNHVDINFFLSSHRDRCWMKFDFLRPFLIELPQEEIILFLKELTYTKDVSENDEDDSEHDEDDSERDEDDSENDEDDSESSKASCSEIEELFYGIESNHDFKFKEVYRWYEFAPYEIVFKDMKKFIYAESSAEERHSMLIVLLKSARKNIELIRKVLQYYLDKHINEPYIHKIRFVNSVLKLHDAFRFDDATWSILNEIFHSLEVYIHSTNNVQQCIITVVLYNVLHGIPVPEVIEQKFIFNTLKEVQTKLDVSEQNKLFDYLYNKLKEKLGIQNINREIGIKQAHELLDNICKLIKVWKKEETHYQFVIDSIVKFSDLNKQLKRDTDMRHLYVSVKPYHRQLFENSIVLYPCEGMCINALKHGPGLLLRYDSEITALCSNDRVSLKTLFSKLRIYWRESLARDWRESFENNCKNVNGHQGIIKGIFGLSSKTQILDFIKMYAPSENKIQWNEGTEIEIRLRKHIAKNLHLARPQLPADVVLWYAKGDYLQYTQLSLNVIYRNLRSKDIEKHIRILLSAPVSLQKHGIRLACKRIEIDELLKIFPSIWKSTRNLSIRSVLFKSVFDFFGKAKDTLVKDIWEVMSFMIDDLNHDENKTIYMTLGKVRAVPLSVIGEFYRKSYLFLRELPKRLGFENVFSSVLGYAKDVIQYLDATFVEKDILVSLCDVFSEKYNWTLMQILSAYLLCSKDEKIQMLKYTKLFEPLFMNCIPKWKSKKFEANVVTNFQSILEYISNDLPRFVFDMKMIMPVQLLTRILNILEAELCHEVQYITVTHWKLSVAYIKLLNDLMIENPDKNYNWDQINRESVNKYARICSENLKEDINEHFPSIYILFADAMQNTLSNFKIEHMNLLYMLNFMLECNDTLEVYLLVLKILPVCQYSYRDSTYIAIKRKLYCYPSDEIKMHYFIKFNDRYLPLTHDFKQDEDTEDDSDDSKIDSSDSE